MYDERFIMVGYSTIDLNPEKYEAKSRKFQSDVVERLNELITNRIEPHYLVLNDDHYLLLLYIEQTHASKYGGMCGFVNKWLDMEVIIDNTSDGWNIVPTVKNYMEFGLFTHSKHYTMEEYNDKFI